MKPIVASWRQFVVLFVPSLCLLVLIVVLAGDSYEGELRGWYWAHVCAPRYEKALGFTMGDLATPDGGRWLWGVTSVATDGPFWQASLRVGDVPVRLPVRFSDGVVRVVDVWHFSKGGKVASFYSFLSRSEGRGPVKFSVCSLEEFYVHGSGCPSREVTISVPAD